MAVTADQAKAIMQAATVDIWNTKSQTERRKLMEQYLAPDVHLCLGPPTAGYDAADQIMDELHAENRSDWEMKPSGDLWVNGNVIMQFWKFGEGHDGYWKGWDVIVVGKDGKVESLYGLVEGINNHAS